MSTPVRLLFTAVAAHGHVLPLAPLMTAALDAGHQVALVTASGLADVIATELPAGVEHLPAGPMPLELATEAARRTGEDLMTPSLHGMGETFGGVLLDLAVHDALRAARSWGPGLVVSEAYDTVGPLVAAVLDLRWFRVRMTAPLPVVLVDAIEAAAARRYDEYGVRPQAPTALLDLWPDVLRDPDLTPPDVGTVLAVRATAHHRPGTSARRRAPGPGRPRVLVSLGTIFSSSADLTAVVDEVERNPVDVVATLGLALQGDDVAGKDRTGAGGGDISFVGFEPIVELLDGVDLVVGVGGAGTVLAALEHGIPLVLWPQGADHPVIAAGVAAAGAGVVVDAPDQIGTAVARVLADDGIRARARDVASSIAAAAPPEDALRAVITNSAPATARGSVTGSATAGAST